jgi:hypothetical protein
LRPCGSIEEEALHRPTFVLAAIAAASLAGPSAAQDLAPTPVELKMVFDSYTKRSGIDPKACTFGVWNRDVISLDRKEAMDNAFARCSLPAGHKVCTRIADEFPDRSAVKDGCITGFDRASLLAMAAVSTRGGFFSVVYETKDRPIRLAQQISLGFGAERDFCELSATLMDREAKLVASSVYHHFVDLLADKTICRSKP